MKQTAIWKDFWREIRHTKSRFISILVLSALAVAFLSGLRSTAPDMKHTGDDYMDTQRQADGHVLSTLGFEQKDVDYLLAHSAVEAAEGAWAVDAHAISPAGDLVVKVHSLSETFNLPVLEQGRLPENGQEIVVEDGILPALGISLGDSLTVRGGGDFDDALAYDTYTVVGVIRSPYYITPERGTSSLGSGTVDAYIYALPAAFDMDTFTQVLLRFQGAGALTSFTEEYDDFVEDTLEELEDYLQQGAQNRYDTVMSEADKTLADAQQELDDAKADAEQELADARKELADGRQELDDGWKEYWDGRQELADALQELTDGEEEVADAQKKIADAEAEIADAKIQIADGEKEIADGEKELEEGRIELLDAERTLSEAYATLQESEESYSAGLALYNSYMEQLDAGAQEFRDAEAAYLAQYQMLVNAGMHAQAEALKNYAEPQLEAKRQELAAAYQQMEAQQAQLAAARRQLDAGWQEYKAGSSDLEMGWREFYEGEKKLNDGKRELDDARKKLADGEKELADGKAELADARQKLTDGWQEYRDGEKELADAYIELTDGEKEYADGLKEYAEGEQEAAEKIAEAQQELDDARQELEELESCDWYGFSRQANPGYTGFGQDADRMGNLASTFPIIFFLVAALVCLTTMTRMVDEQRIQIGALKALGYSRSAISRKYVGYGLLASCIGSVFGLAVGCSLIPSMIYVAYQIMYEMPDLQLRFYPEIGLVATAAAIFCTVGSTLAACLSTLTATPATLMRPRTPKAGKRVFLEYIKPLWKRLGFIHKVTARNLFRYQKRFWMTVAGIGGCTALIIAAFGLRSSLLMTMSNQFGDIYHYHAQVVLDEDAPAEETEAFYAYLAQEELVESYYESYLATVTAESGRSITAYMIGMEPEKLGEYLDLRTRVEKTPLTLDDSGVIMTEKLSELLGLSVGDTFVVDADSRREVKIAAITEHYVGHFIYISPGYYQQVFGEEMQPNSSFIRFTDSSKQTGEQVFTQLLAHDCVLSINRMEDVRDTYEQSMERIDFVVIIVIIAAGALAFVVLFNLSNINISERLRELATIKLLGFYDREVSAYVYRENIVLTIFGILLGMVFGHYLHIYLVHSTEIDLMMFGRTTPPTAYLYAAALTVFFSVLVNVGAHFKMKKINMVESLKSAE